MVTTGVDILGGMLPLQQGAAMHILVCCIQVVESFVNVGKKWYLWDTNLPRYFCLSPLQGCIFHCPREQRRCHYPLGQTMPPTLQIRATWKKCVVLFLFKFLWHRFHLIAVTPLDHFFKWNPACMLRFDVHNYDMSFFAGCQVISWGGLIKPGCIFPSVVTLLALQSYEPLHPLPP